MGSGSSKNQVTQYQAIQQLQMSDPLRQGHSSSTNQQHRNAAVPSSPRSRQNYNPRRSEPEWPLPPHDLPSAFKPNWPPYVDRYSVKRAYNAKITHSNKRIKLTASQAQVRQEFHQKETSSSQWEKDHSSISSSAHVQSSLKTQSHSCINLSTTEEIDRLLLSLNEVHSQIDVNVVHRQKIVSLVTKMIVDIIINDTRDAQQLLLEFAKDQQTIQDQLYHEWLQMYVAALDAWKSARLADLQQNLEKHQKGIMLYSQQMITMVNSEANKLRDDILQAEQISASTLIQNITDKIQTMSTHHLGTETMTKINLIIHGNVGTKAPGQCCVFDFEQNNSSVNPPNSIGGGRPLKPLSIQPQPFGRGKLVVRGKPPIRGKPTNRPTGTRLQISRPAPAEVTNNSSIYEEQEEGHNDDNDDDYEDYNEDETSTIYRNT